LQVKAGRYAEAIVVALGEVVGPGLAVAELHEFVP
jgi:hypothetical protein